MRKDEAYKQGMKDAIDPFKKSIIEDVHQAIKAQDELLEIIIDCIDFGSDDPEEFKKLMNKIRQKAQKPKQFRIAIIYDSKKNEDLADLLRKDLNNRKHSCEIMDYASFKKNAGSIVDYRVFLGNSEKFRERYTKVLYKAYGMRILQLDHSFAVDCDPKYKFSEENKDAFIAYYEKTIRKTLERSHEMKKAINERKRRKQNSDKLGTYAAMEALDKSTDIWEHTSALVTLVLGIPAMLLSMVALLCLIPVGIGEVALKNTVDKLKEANFDKKFIADAQRQILEVKLVDLFLREQLDDIRYINA